MVLKSIVVLNLSVKPWPLLRQVMVLLLRLHLINHLHKVGRLSSDLLVFKREHMIVFSLGLRCVSKAVPGTILALVLHLNDYLFQLCDSLILSVHFSHLILKLLFFDGQQLSEKLILFAEVLDHELFLRVVYEFAHVLCALLRRGRVAIRVEAHLVPTVALNRSHH